MSQCDTVLHHMRKKGPISTFEAFTQYGVTRLPARIADLKDRGISIKDRWAEAHNGKRFKRYFIA